MQVLSISEKPELMNDAIKYIQEKWATEESMMLYEDCIKHSIDKKKLLPQWYLLLKDEKIIGCAGSITNDFISRMDLYPWLCALYIEDDYQGNGYARFLLERAETDTKRANYPYIYLCTDHYNLYEKYNYTFKAIGYHPWGEQSRIYEKQV